MQAKKDVMALTLADWKEAIQVQDACNLSGVARGFCDVMTRISASDPGVGTAWRNTHPIAVLWASKIAHLTGIQGGEREITQFGLAYEYVSAVIALAEARAAEPLCGVEKTLGFCRFHSVKDPITL